MKKGTKLAVITISLLIIGMSLPIISAENTFEESSPEFKIGLETTISLGWNYGGVQIYVKNIGDATAHNVTLTDFQIDGLVLYNNRGASWFRDEYDIELGDTIHGYPETCILGFGRFTATMTVTCDEGVNGTGSGNGFILGPLIFVP
jgi:hypothetical protein